MAEVIRRILAAVVVAIGLAALLGWRSLREVDPLRMTSAKATQPRPQLADLMPYSQPLSDTLVADGHRRAIMLPRDPFGPLEMPRFPANSRRTVAARDSEGSATSRALRVTATMIAGARRAAVINDELIYVGERVPGGGKLKSVDRDRVVVVDAAGASHVVAVNEGAER